MLANEQVEELICVVSNLDRDELVRQFHAYPSPFPIDFTEEFLQKTPLARFALASTSISREAPSSITHVSSARRASSPSELRASIRVAAAVIG